MKIPRWLPPAALLAIHLKKAQQHQRTCPKCRNKDLLAIAIDVFHIWEAL